jgi:hypothetical protein
MRRTGIEDAVSSEAWLRQTLDEILARVRTLLGVTGCAFQVVDWRRGVIRPAAETAGDALVGSVVDRGRTDLWLENALAPHGSPGTPAAMEERDPHHEDTGIEPDDAKPTGAEGGNGAPAPFETPDEDPRPVEEAGEDREREARGGDA